MTQKRFTSWGNRIKRNGKLLNIEFKTKLDAKLCCKLCNQMDKENQEYVDKLNEIFKWYKDYYGETILDTRMGWNDDNKISKLEKENEQLKKEKERYKKLSEIRQQQINNRILTIKEFINNCSDNKVRSVLKELFYSEVKEYDLSAQNRKLLHENGQLKQQLTDVGRLIDCKIAEYQKYDGYDTKKYYIGTQLLKELKKEFER